jgi:hypothetical protein
MDNYLQISWRGKDKPTKSKSTKYFQRFCANWWIKAIETGDVDAELAASHQVIQGTGRTLVPSPYDNDKFPEVNPMGLEDTWRAMLEDKSRFNLELWMTSGGTSRDEMHEGLAGI